MSGEGLTLEMVMAAIRKLEAMPPVPKPLRIMYTPYALENSTERLFPASKNRSKRIHKKLVKRFGGEFRQQPAMWRFNGVIYAHPAHRARIQKMLEEGTVPVDQPPPSPYPVASFNAINVAAFVA